MEVENPEQLYHTTLTVTDNAANSSRATRAVYVLATHSNLEAAKRFAISALESVLNYTPDDFAVHRVREGDRPWSHGDGALLFAKAYSGQEFLVALDTTPNPENLSTSPDGGIVLPGGAGHLHYVLQTKIDYNKDRSGNAQSTEIEGCFVRRADALAAALRCLAADNSEFAQYDERGDTGTADEWPFGEDVLVHAVSHFGENYTIAVITPPSAHKVANAKGHRKHPETSWKRQNADTGSTGD